MRHAGSLASIAPIAAPQEVVDVYLKTHPRANIETAQKGETIVHEDEFADHSMLLLDGWLAFTKMLPEGEAQIIDVMLPGDFALIGAVSAPVAACSVEALSDVRYINIHPAQLNGPTPEMALLRDLMAGEIVRTQSRTSELLLRMGKGNAAARVAYVLLEMFVRLEAIGKARDARFDFPLTQQRIGDIAGLSNVHVCRTMRRFERDGTISYPSHSEIALNDLAALCDVAGVDLDALRHEILLHKIG